MRFFLRTIIIPLCFLFSGNLYAQTTYDWTGAVNTDWSNPANWESTTGGVITNPAATYPGPNDMARIGVLLLTNAANFPVISPGGATSVGTIVWGTENYLTVSLVVNTTFTVNGDINNTSAVTGNGSVSSYVFNLSGTGTFLVTGNLNIGYDDGFGTPNPGNNNSFAFNSSISAIKISGSVYLNVYQGDTHHRGFVPALNITAGTFTTTSVQSVLTNSTTLNAILTSNLTVGNSSGSPAATLQLTGANALPSFSPYVTNTIKFNNPGATVEYSGTTSQTVYTDTSIPNLSNTISYYNIKFSGTGLKTALPGNLNIAGDFTNTLANDACGCNTVVLSAPLVNFNGTTQSLYGGGGSGTTFYNVNFSNSGTKSMLSGTFNLASTGVLTMIGSTTSLAAGNGIFTLLSDASSSATIAAIPKGTSITGTVNVQRYIQGSSTSTLKRGYRLISSTVYTGTSGGVNVFDINYLMNSVFVSGLSGTANGFNISTPTNHSSIYIFREDVTPPPANGVLFLTEYNWKGLAKLNNPNPYDVGTQKRLTTALVADTTTTIPVGNGVLFYFRGDKTLNNGTSAGTKIVAPYNFPENVTTTQTGTLNTGTVNVKLWFANAANNLGNKLSYTPGTVNIGTSSLRGGYTFVGNPYAATINWEKYNRNTTNSSIYGGGGLGSTIWVYNEASNQFETYVQKASVTSVADTTTSINPGTATGSASNMIASGQGFFVRATVAGQTLSFRETAKTNTQPVAASLHNLMGRPVATSATVQSDPLLRLKLSLDDVNTDEIVIRLNNNASANFVESEDAEDLGGMSPLVSLSSLSSEGILLAINFLPFPGLQQQIVPLSTDFVYSGTYNLTRTQLDDLPSLYEVWLKDAFTCDSLNLKSNSTYQFKVNKSDSSTFGSKRFSIVFRQDPALALSLLNFDGKKANNKSLLTWNAKNEFGTTTFFIQRSIDGGKTFESIGSMQSDGTGIYNFLDKQPNVGQNQYRLQIRDINGSLSYSNIVTLTYTENSDANLKINIFPNPASNVINLSLAPGLKESTYHVSIVNTLGSTVKEGTFQQNNWNTNISNLQPGSYLVHVTDNKDKTVVGMGNFVKN